MEISRRELGALALGSFVTSAMSEAQAATEAAFAGATDCHVHIIGPQAKYPMVPNRPYTPPEATVAQLQAWHARLGITRSVLVQPSFYGTDNSCLLDALAQLGNDARQRLQRIGGNSAVHAGMQIGHGAAGFEFGVNHAA